MPSVSSLAAELALRHIDTKDADDVLRLSWKAGDSLQAYNNARDAFRALARRYNEFCREFKKATVATDLDRTYHGTMLKKLHAVRVILEQLTTKFRENITLEWPEQVQAARPALSVQQLEDKLSRVDALRQSLNQMTKEFADFFKRNDYNYVVMHQLPNLELIAQCIYKLIDLFQAVEHVTAERTAVNQALFKSACATLEHAYRVLWHDYVLPVQAWHGKGLLDICHDVHKLNDEQWETAKTFFKQPYRCVA